MTKVFIGGLNGEVEEMDIAILVSLHGDLKSVKVVRDRKTKKCKGYAFIELGNESDAANIIEVLNGQKFRNNIITVKKMEEPEKKAKPRNWVGKKR